MNILPRLAAFMAQGLCKLGPHFTIHSLFSADGVE